MSDSYTEMFRRLSPLTDYLPFPNIQVDRLLSLIPGQRGTPVASPTPARTAPTEIGAATPTVPLQPRQIYSEPVGPTRPPTITPGTASTPAPRMPTPPQPTGEGESEQSLLDMLRNRTAKKFNNENLESLSDIGAGMLASESPNFFTMLGAGLKNARERETERARELREVAADERRAMMEKAKFVEETSPESLTGRLRQAQIASYLAQAGSTNRPQYQLIGTDANGNAIVVDMRNPSNTRTLEGVRPTNMMRGQLTPQAMATLYQRASSQAQREATAGAIPRDEQWINDRTRTLYENALIEADRGFTSPGVRAPATSERPATPDANVRNLPGLR
jgi:hypothetical protein